MGNTERDFQVTKESFEPDVLWTKEKLLARVTQEEIFEYYLGVKVEYGVKFCSPLRKDKNPTCSFTKRRDGTILYRDWAEPKAKDCFSVVEEMFGVDFYTALEIIAKDMGLTDKEPNRGKKNYSREEANKNKPYHSEKSIIKVRTQPLTDKDLNYFKSYHISKRILNHYNVYSVKHVWLNNSLLYVYSEDNPVVGYYFGLDDENNQKWKLYYYKKSSGIRFLGNTNRINGWIQIPEEGKDLVITKSMKDVMSLAVYSIPSIAMQAETQIPYDYIIEELKERYDNIYTLLDFDKAGIRSANIIKRRYDIPPLFLTNGRFGSINYSYKDFSDYIKGEGYEAGKSLISSARRLLKSNENLFPVLSS